MGNKFDALFVSQMVVYTMYLSSVMLGLHVATNWSATGTVLSSVLWLFACLAVIMMVCIAGGVLSVTENVARYRSLKHLEDTKLAGMLTERLQRQYPSFVLTREDVYAELQNVRSDCLWGERW